MTHTQPAPSLARGAAVMTAVTAVSRVTGFVRVVVVAAAMGTTFLANTYQTANTAPNLLFELVAAGVLTSVFVPTFVEYLARRDDRGGWDAANALTSVALVALIGVAVVLALAAPLVMKLLTVGVADPQLRADEVALGSAFLRMFAPQIVFYGAGMVMTGALHAHRRFGLTAAAPILNNVVVICVYVAYAVMRGDRPPTVDQITSGETLLLGFGTTAGVVAMTACLIPQLRRLGWRFRFRPDTSHPAVRRAVRVGTWALGYAGGYQAGLVVVLVLANRIEGGVAAYQWAYTYFFVPHALFAMPVFSVLFPAMAEDVARGDRAAMLERLRDGLAMLLFVLVPLAAVIVVAAGPIARLTLDYGAMTEGGAALVARVLAAFGVGLPAYSVFLVLTRAYYALGDAKTPALVNAGTVAAAALTGASLFASVPAGWEVAGLALGHSVAFAGGAAVLAHLLADRTGPLATPRLRAAAARSTVWGGVALVAMLMVAVALPHGSKAVALLDTAAIAGAGAVAYVGGMWRAGSPELARLVRLVRRS